MTVTVRTAPESRENYDERVEKRLHRSGEERSICQALVNTISYTSRTPSASMFGESPGTGSHSAKRLRVLIAEDDRDSAASLESLVQLEGHDTRCVHRGRDVVGGARDFGCDVVLLDIGMPGINGYDIARIFRKTYGSAK